MSLPPKNSNFWICRLGPEDIADWESGSLNQKTSALGIKGLIVPLYVNDEDNLTKSILKHPNSRLLEAP